MIDFMHLYLFHHMSEPDESRRRVRHYVMASDGFYLLLPVTDDLCIYFLLQRIDGADFYAFNK